MKRLIFLLGFFLISCTTTDQEPRTFEEQVADQMKMEEMLIRERDQRPEGWIYSNGNIYK